MSQQQITPKCRLCNTLCIAHLQAQPAQIAPKPTPQTSAGTQLITHIQEGYVSWRLRLQRKQKQYLRVKPSDVYGCILVPVCSVLSDQVCTYTSCDASSGNCSHGEDTKRSCLASAEERRSQSQATGRDVDDVRPL